MHAESLIDQVALTDDQMVGFIRLGSDNSENFYQIEIPLKVTQPSNCSTLSASLVWPEDNEIDLSLELLSKLKIVYQKIATDILPVDGIYYLSEDDENLDPSLGSKINKLKLGIKGSPNLGLVRTLMIGIKNNTSQQYIKGEVWFDELRLAEMDNSGGMAAVLNIDSNLADFATVSVTAKMNTAGFGSLEQSSSERSLDDMQQYNVITNMSLGKLLPEKWAVNLPFNYGLSEEFITPKYDPKNPDILLKTMLDNAESDEERNEIKNRSIEYTKNNSINFIGIRKERLPEQKQQIYDVENFTLSQTYNKTIKSSYEIEDYSYEKTSSSINYIYGFKPKSITPFKDTKFMKKSSYWKLFTDLNINLLPSNITFNTSVNRDYNKQQFRQVEVEGITIDPLYKRNFKFNYDYGFNLDLTKSLKVHFSATSSNIVKNYLNNENEIVDDFKVWEDYFNIGNPNNHSQELVLNYEIPFSKIPFLSFIKASMSYAGTYNWQKSSDALSQYEDEDSGITYNLGNTIQNSNSKTLNSSFAMESFYRFLGLKKSNITKNAIQKQVKSKPGDKVTLQNVELPIKNNSFKDGVLQIITSIKNIQINYTENNGTVLPGFVQEVGFFGTSKPTLGFVFGSQEDIRFLAAKKGWLTKYGDFNESFTQSINKVVKASAQVELFPEFKIDLIADRSYSENSSEQFDVSNGVYNSRLPYRTGSFSISTIMIGSSFLNSDENNAIVFDEFRKNRIIIARRLAEKRGISTSNSSNFDLDGYPIGYGKNSQLVLLPAFLAAYTGVSSSNVSLGVFRNIPVPNWNIKYNGLMRYDFFKNNFTRISIQNSYRAAYTVNSFQSNLKAIQTPDGLDDSGNYYASTILSNVNLTEQFNPLIKLDFELKNAFKIATEVKKDRTLAMSFDNNLLTETNAIEYIVGCGYRFKDVIFNSKLADNATGTIKGDINLKFDLSLRKNKTIVRYLDYDNNDLTAGQNIWALKIGADYVLSKNLSTAFYYDHSFSKPLVSTYYPITNIKTGITLRYTFGN